MWDFLQRCFVGPNLPASVLLLAIVGYWLMVIVGAIGLDLFDIDLPSADDHPDGEIESFLGVGAVPLRFLNIGQVPTMLWGSLFALAWWSVSLLLDQPGQQLDVGTASVLVVRNIGIAIVAAKVLTEPLRGKFATIQPPRSASLVGREVLVTIEANEHSGQASLRMDGAPLFLDVCTRSGVIAKGEAAVLVDYSPEKNLYVIEKKPDSSSTVRSEVL